VVAGKPVALFYGDRDTGSLLEFLPGELVLLKTLRDQAVMAFRNHG
jgi:hypothetical protein